MRVLVFPQIPDKNRHTSSKEIPNPTHPWSGPLETSQLIFLVGTVIYGGIRLHFQRHCSGEKKAIHKDNLFDWFLVWFIIVGQAVIPLILILSPWLDFANYPLPEWTAYIGGPVMAFGLWLFWRSHTDLGRSWSVSLKLKKTHQLVTNGVYSLVRHPMYASFFVLGISQALLLGNWLAGWSGLLASALLYSVRRTSEEQMMLDSFGEEYVTYRQRTGGVIPRIWATQKQSDS